MLHDQIIVVAIATDKQELEQRITTRADEIFSGGIVEEAKRLALQYGWDHESMSGNIYPIVKRYIDGEITIDQAKELFIVKDRQLAKKQITWLKRHDHIKWLTRNEAEHFLVNRISQLSVDPMPSDNI